MAGFAVAAIAITGQLVAVNPMRAFASTWPGPDDGSGKYAHCNVYVYYSSISSNPLQEFACQYTLGNGPSGASPTNVVDTGVSPPLSFGTWTYACTGTCSSSTSGTAATFASFDTNTAGHLVRNTGSFGLNGAGSVTSASYSGCTITFTNRGTNGVPAANAPCVIDNVFLNAAPNPPVLPTNNYPGATAGPALDATQGTSSCSRTLSDTSTMIAEFAAGRTGMANATVTAWSWAWGDGTTAGTTVPPVKHNYPTPITSEPQDGWTATVTMTVTATSGHLFLDGTGVKTGTCSMRVDFLHPENLTPGSTGGGSTGTTALDSCLPSGWSVLNPLAVIGGMGCALQVLFIPSSLDTSSMQSAFAGAFPVNWIGAVVDGGVAMHDDLNGSVGTIDEAGLNGRCSPAMNVPLSDITGDGGDDWTIRLPTPPSPDVECPGMFAGDHGGSRPDRSDIDDAVGSFFGWRKLLRELERVGLWFAFAVVLVKLMPWVRGTPIPMGDGFDWQDDSPVRPDVNGDGAGGYFDDYR
jgi:hypothetical protein